MLEYQIPHKAREDLIDILAAIEIDMEHTTNMPPHLCKLMVCQLLISLVDSMQKQATMLEKESAKTEDIN